MQMIGLFRSNNQRNLHKLSYFHKASEKKRKKICTAQFTLKTMDLGR